MAKRKQEAIVPVDPYQEQWQLIRGKRIVAMNRTDARITFLLEDDTQIHFDQIDIGHDPYEPVFVLNMTVEGSRPAWQFS